MTFTHVFAGLAAADYPSAVGFYERLYGRRPDVIVKDDECMWEVTAGGWMYLLADPDRAGQGQITILVEDLDEQLAQLAGRGIETPPVQTMGNGVRTATIEDADGNLVKFGQVPGDPAG